MSDDLQDAIATAYSDGKLYIPGACDCCVCGLVIADAVLATPELQAIRKALCRLATDVADDVRPNVAEWLALYNLPPSVVAWVLDGEGSPLVTGIWPSRAGEGTHALAGET